MTITQVLGQYHKAVPFPWTPEKIKEAGFCPAEFMLSLRDDLQKCDQSDHEVVREIIRLMDRLEVEIKKQIQKN